MMNPVTKKAYKVEFETTPITLHELLIKYNITQEELGSTDMWEKRVKPTEIITKPRAPHKNLPDITLDDKSMLDEIDDTKKLILVKVKEYFSEDGDSEFASTKEFKDMVGVLKDLEAGELVKEGKADKGPTINILVQNLTERFRDDC